MHRLVHVLHCLQVEQPAADHCRKAEKESPDEFNEVYENVVGKLESKINDPSVADDELKK